AKAASSPNLTVTGDVVGTLQYLSPEQLKGGTSDTRADIWALGILFYEMISGDVPFKANTIGDLCDRIMRGNYTPPSALNRNVPGSVDSIISRCLKKNPASRYQSAQEMLNEINHAAAALGPGRVNEQPEMSSPPAGIRWWPILGGGTGAAVVLTVAGLFLFGGDQTRNSNDNRNSRGGGAANINAGQKQTLVTSSSQSGPQVDPGAERVVTTIDVDEAIGKAEVFVNGENRGPTPYSLEGKHGQEFDIVVKKPGFEEFRIPSFRVSVGRTQYLISTGMMRKKG
ncbi:MAG: protein kinase, partial [Blastocatellia bacterium]